MRRELPYFKIEDGFGGNQDWFSDPMMKLGGCAAATACDLSVYMALYMGKSDLYPYDENNLTRKDYVEFSKKMKPYLHPRMSGINRLDIYTEGFGRYLRDAGEEGILMEEFSGERPVSEAKEKVKAQIEDGMPVPSLLLKHRDPALKDFVWHWFLLTGYEEFEQVFMVKTVTYGEYLWLDLDRLWNTGFSEKGGLILLNNR